MKKFLYIVFFFVFFLKSNDKVGHIFLVYQFFKSDNTEVYKECQLRINTTQKKIEFHNEPVAVVKLNHVIDIVARQKAFNAIRESLLQYCDGLTSKNEYFDNLIFTDSTNMKETFCLFPTLSFYEKIIAANERIEKAKNDWGQECLDLKQELQKGADGIFGYKVTFAIQHIFSQSIQKYSYWFPLDPTKEVIKLV